MRAYILCKGSLRHTKYRQNTIAARSIIYNIIYMEYSQAHSRAARQNAMVAARRPYRGEEMFQTAATPSEKHLTRRYKISLSAMPATGARGKSPVYERAAPSPLPPEEAHLLSGSEQP